MRATLVLEKFTEDSDPITDMGIGGDEWKFKNLKAGDILKIKRPVHSYNLGGFLVITQDIEKRPGGVSYSHTLFYYYVSTKLGLKNFAKQFNRTEMLDSIGRGWAMDFKFYKDTLEKMPYTLTDIRENPGMIFEKFTEDSDPITDMGIGVRPLISKWMKEIGEKDTDDNALVHCAKRGKTEWVKFLLDRGANVHANDDIALQLASKYGHTEIVKLLLDRGADVHVNNDSALSWASNNGHVEIVKLLLDRGADVHVNNDSALSWASENGRTEVVKLLLDRGADVHAADDYALRWASSSGHLEVVKVLLDRGADINANDDYALRYASINGHVEVVKVLLDAGANVHANDDYALRWASRKGHTEVVKILKDHMKKNKVVKESLLEKFTEDSDPITDMGIGLNTDRIIKTLIKHDYKKMIYGFEVTGAVGRNKQHLPGTYFKILLYANDFFYEKDGKKKRMTANNRILYINEIIQAAGFEHLFVKLDFDYKSYTVINCRIDTRYKRFFNPGRYYVKTRAGASLTEKYEEDSDPIADMGIGLSSKITNKHLQDMSILYSDYLWLEPDADPFEEYPFLKDFRKNEPLIFNYLTDLEKQGDLFFSSFIPYDGINWSIKIMNRKVNNIIKRYTGKYTYHYILGGSWDGVMVVFSNVKFPKIKNSLV